MFFCQLASNHAARKLQAPYKNFVISGVNESMLSLMPLIVDLEINSCSASQMHCICTRIFERYSYH